MAKEIALTTHDNPYCPFDQWEDWYRYDMDHGYDCCGKLAKLVRTSDQLTPKENEDEMEIAIDEWIEEDILDVYKKLTRETDENINKII